MANFLSLSDLAAFAFLMCFVVAVVSIHLMRLAANKELPDGEKISYFLSFDKWDKIIRSYRCLYPRGRLYTIFRLVAIGTAALGLGSVLAAIWKLVVTG